MKGLSAFVALCLIGHGRGFGFRRTPADTSYQPIKRWNFYHPSFFAPPTNTFYSRKQDFLPPAGWSEAWEPVANLVDAAPPMKLEVSWPNNVKINAMNQTISTGLMREKPTLSWAAEPGALYTVMVVGLFDVGLPPSDRPLVFIHWIVTNIPGNSIELGTEIYDYIGVFAIKFDADNNIVKDPEQSNHGILLMVYKQPSPIVMEEGQAGCNPEIAQSRVTDYRNLASKYGLQLVAGNYLQVPWSGYHTQERLCYLSKCVGQQFPFPIADVNDLPECQPRKDVIDFTVIGPQLAKWKEYAKYRSLFSRDSITSAIQDTYPTYSTGKIADFTAIEGAYNGAPFTTNNQPQTLEGVVDLSILQYQDVEATETLFSKAGELSGGPISKIFPNLAAGGKALKIILSKPHDQDFDFMTLLSKPGSVFQLFILKVKEGEMEEFEALRDQFIAKSRSSRNIGRVYKFNVDQDILEGEKGTPLYFDSSNNAITLAVFDSMAHRQNYFTELGRDAEFAQFASTFDCIVCSVMTNNLHSTYYPPFN